MTLNQLEYFCAVCRYHSITRAADELFVSQPTISLAIKDLEKEFHLHLFNHGKNRISLTEDGEYFYKKAQKLITQSQDMYTEFSSLGKSIRPIKIGIPPLISTVFFPKMMDAFHENNDIPLQLFEYGSVRACNLVDRKELDLALVNLDFYNIKKFNYHVLMEDKTVYCVSLHHPLAQKESVSVDMLKEESIIFYNTDSVQNQTVTARFHSLGLTPKILLHSSQLYTTLNFIKNGNCGAFLYSSLAVNPRDFIKIPIHPDLTTQFGIIWNKDALQKHTLSFIEFAKQYDITSFL